jgi:TP901-1 family phage major tail protein
MAQTVGILNGTLAKIEVGGTVIAHLTSNGISVSHSTRDASSKGSGGAKESLEGQTSWSISGEGLFAEDASYGYEDLWDAWLARTKLTITYSDAVADDIEYSGDAYITSLDRTDGMEESVTFSVSLEGTGVLAKATIT